LDNEWQFTKKKEIVLSKYSLKHLTNCLVSFQSSVSDAKPVATSNRWPSYRFSTEFNVRFGFPLSLDWNKNK